MRNIIYFILVLLLFGCSDNEENFNILGTVWRLEKNGETREIQFLSSRSIEKRVEYRKISLDLRLSLEYNYLINADTSEEIYIITRDEIVGAGCNCRSSELEDLILINPKRIGFTISADRKVMKVDFFELIQSLSGGSELEITESDEYKRVK